jgi:serine/threonine-protein kinase
MSRCPACGAQFNKNGVCTACGERRSDSTVAFSNAPPISNPTPVSNPSLKHSALDEGRFPAGTLLAERYRITGLLGKGGMGEVYRANDLRLGQTVALKFLPSGTSTEMLVRFQAEVRIARQVSHPNICRVYDIGEVQGHTYLSMEYVDGEDLRSLLRRIGRLPADKALEIARKLCAGLAAAHDKGVLHRDLKPANVMLDGRGQVLITDFGLAGLVGQVVGGEIRNGTPAYMAPEQLAGREVTVRSDIYALGLVLYEIFTGKHAFESGVARTTPSSISSSVKDVDPAVERAILRCLELDPAHRPASALAVAAALPGGDPLAAALAAGETPTPAMVAASGDTEGLSVRAAWTCLAFSLLGLAVAFLVESQLSLQKRIPFDLSSAVLAEKARETVRALGYPDAPLDQAYGFQLLPEARTFVELPENAAALPAILKAAQPPILVFWYRQSPRYLEKMNPLPLEEGINPRDPPPNSPGEVVLEVDTRGRLTSFHAVPPAVDANQPTPAKWEALLSAAGFDPARLQSAVPIWTPTMAFDQRIAWTGTLEHAPQINLRIEAAAWRGRPVYFHIFGPWIKPEPPLSPPGRPGGAAAWGIALLVLLGVLLPGSLMAWQNLRAGRADLTGASRLAIFAFLSSLITWFCATNFAPTGSWVITQQFRALAFCFSNGILLWGLYIAIEPHVRRRWPQAMVSWSRVLAGRIRDPLVGSHVLIGSVLGTGTLLITSLGGLLGEGNGGIALPNAYLWIVDTRPMIGNVFSQLSTGVGAGLGIFLIVFLLRVLVRNQWLAAGVLVLIITGISVLVARNNQSLQVWVVAAEIAALFTLFIGAMLRFGLLPMIVAFFFGIGSEFWNSNVSVWYSGSNVFSVVLVLALLGYAFFTTVAGRPLLPAGMLDHDVH